MDMLHNNDCAEFDLKKRWELRSPKDFPHSSARSWGFDEYGLWQDFRTDDVQFKMRYIPPGRFLIKTPDQVRFVCIQ